MKKAFFFLLTSLCIPGFSQGIRILQGNTDVTGNTLIESIAPNMDYKTVLRLYNTTNQKKTLALSRTLKNRVAADYYVYFCYDIMATAPQEDSVFIAPTHFSIDAKSYLPGNSENFGLTVFLTSGPVCKDHIVVYKVWDADDPTDVSEITIHYSCPTGIWEFETGDFSNAFPNPASSEATVNYTLTDFSAHSSVAITDLTGKLIKQFPLYKKEGSIKIDVEDVQNGLYFYTFVVDGKRVMTGKLIVQK